METAREQLEPTGISQSAGTSQPISRNSQSTGTSQLAGISREQPGSARKQQENGEKEKNRLTCLGSGVKIDMDFIDTRAANAAE